MPYEIVYDRDALADDEVLMRWLEIPEVKERFAQSRRRAAQGITVSEEEAMEELGISEAEVSGEIVGASTSIPSHRLGRRPAGLVA